MALPVGPWNSFIVNKGFRPDQPAFDVPGIGLLFSEYQVLQANANTATASGGGPGGPSQAVISLFKSGDLDVAAVDFDNNGTPTNISPIIVPFTTATIEEFSLYSTANTADYDVEFLLSTNGGVSYNPLTSVSIVAGVTTNNQTLSVGGLSAGDLIRVRYSRTTGAGTFVSNPTVQFILQSV